jgi:hypothetical protein
MAPFAAERRSSYAPDLLPVECELPPTWAPWQSRAVASLVIPVQESEKGQHIDFAKTYKVDAQAIRLIRL